MPERGRGGRPWGPIRAESEEASKLASFLREQVDVSGKSLAMLQKEMHISKTQIGEKLAGKRIDRVFVAALLRATISEPRLRERRAAEAETLLAAAERPIPQAGRLNTGFKAELEQLRVQQVDTLLQLTRSLEQQNQLRQAVGNSTMLVFVLLGMLHKLELRTTSLTVERDQLLDRRLDDQALQRAEQQLNRAFQQEKRAGEELQRAKDKQRQAEELAAKVQARVDELTEELVRLRASAPGDHHHRVSEQVSSSSETPTDPVGDDIDRALAHAASINDEEAQTLQSITEGLSEDEKKEGLLQESLPERATDSSITDAGAADNSNVVVGQSPLEFKVFHSHYRSVYVRWAELYLGSRVEAEDIVDAAMLELLEQWSEFLEQPQPAAYAWWLVRNRVQDAGRKRSRLQMMTDVIFTTAARYKETDPIGALEDSMALWQAIDSLPERQHEVVLLHFILGFTNRETAGVLGVTETTVRSSLRDARRRLALAIGG